MNSMTQTGATLLQDLLPLLEEGRYIPALDFLREGLSQLRGQSTMAEWREFCAETFSAKHFQYHPLSRLLKAGPLESGPAGAARGLIHEPLTLDVIYGLDRTPPLLDLRRRRIAAVVELAWGFCTGLRAAASLIGPRIERFGQLG